VRVAIGAGRARLVRQLFTESLVLSSIGAVLAFALANWGARMLVLLAGQQVAADTGWMTVGFTVAVAFGVTCLFGIAPALAATRVDVLAALRSNRRGQSGGRRRLAMGRALMVAQVSISLLLVSSGGLLVETFRNLRHRDFGFEPDKVLQVSLPLEMGRDAMRRSNALRHPLYERINALPGVRVASVSSCGPFASVEHTGPFAAPGRPAQASDGSRIVHVSPGYFETMVRIVTGRGITGDDRQGSPPVAVLSQTAALKLFGGQDPVGKFISGEKQFDARQQILVIGVAHDVRAAARDAYGFIVYVPLAQNPAPLTDIDLRASGDPARLSAAVRSTLADIDPSLRVGEIRVLRDAIDAGLTQEKMMAWLSTCFGALALLLTFVGVYGVIGYAVERRRQEIGIRLALGARRGQIAGLILKDVGLLLGGVGALAASRALKNLLFGIGSVDGMLLVAALSIAAVATVAGWLPARRASRLDPMAALREP
jgi:predicted permease